MYAVLVVPTDFGAHANVLTIFINIKRYIPGTGTYKSPG